MTAADTLAIQACGQIQQANRRMVSPIGNDSVAQGLTYDAFRAASQASQLDHSYDVLASYIGQVGRAGYSPTQAAA